MAEYRGTPTSNIYTVLTLIALVVLLFGTVFICIWSKSIFGTANPFSVKVSSATSLVATAVDA